VTLENAYHLLLDQTDLDEAMTDLASSYQTMRRRELADHFANRFLSQPPEQIGGVKETIANFERGEIHRRIAGAVRSFPTAFASVCAARG
jgi:predicted RNA-binding protein with EMAP domain